MPKNFYAIALIIVILGGGYWLYSNSSNSDEGENNLAKIINATSSYGIDQNNADKGNSIATTSATSGISSTTTVITNNSNNNKKTMNATFHTNKGDITIELNNTGTTPNTVANFVKLAGEGFYNGVKFHRVIKGFMIQGGDPLTKDDSKSGVWGTGGPGYQFNDELTAGNHNDIGTISMANSGPNTNGSQFFINVAANNFLDGKHVVFGKVSKGMDIVTAIENTPTGQDDRPVQPVIIESISLK